MQLLVSSLVLVAIVSIVILPLEWLCSLFLSAETIDSTLRAFRHASGSMIPFLLVTVCRYCNVKMFENAFFAGLATRDPELAAQIRQVDRSTHSPPNLSICGVPGRLRSNAFA